MLQSRSFYLSPIYKISSKHQLVSWTGSLGLGVTAFKISSPACENYPAYPELWAPWLSVNLFHARFCTWLYIDALWMSDHIAGCTQIVFFLSSFLQFDSWLSFYVLFFFLVAYLVKILVWGILPRALSMSCPFPFQMASLVPTCRYTSRTMVL